MSHQPNVILRGNIKQINLGTSSFQKIIGNNNFYIDKTQFIDHFLDEPNDVQLIVRQRRLGKSLNLDTLQCFLTDKEDNHALFQGLSIEQSARFNQCNSTPAFYFDFKNLNLIDYKRQIAKQIFVHLCDYVDVTTLTGALKMTFESWFNYIESSTEGLLILTELIYHTTGKRTYLLIDEYDNLLTDSYNKPVYEDIKAFLTKLLTAGLKGNRYLEKALMTGVMRVSKESILSGLNNLRVYDLFTDGIYTDDFGLTESEIDAMNQQIPFDKAKLKAWYNGIKINGHSIYNIYAVLSFLQEGTYLNYWGRSGTVDMIVGMMNANREIVITKLLNGEVINVEMAMRISLQELNAISPDSTFYSLLAQTGYISVEQMNEQRNQAMIKIPNIELMNVWKEFILKQVVKDNGMLRTLFDNLKFDKLNGSLLDPLSLAQFNLDVTRFLSDKLSYFDLPKAQELALMQYSELPDKTREQIYHVFVLGLLSAYEDAHYSKPPQSNLEAGDGRYDILFERNDLSAIFEFKSVTEPKDLESAAVKGLQQIDDKRYFVGAPSNKPLIKVAIAFCGKLCLVRSAIHVWR